MNKNSVFVHIGQSSLAALTVMAWQPQKSHAADFFDNNAIENAESQGRVDLSIFEKSGLIPAGNYKVDIFLNGQHVDNKDIYFEIVNNEILPQLSESDLIK